MCRFDASSQKLVGVTRVKAKTFLPSAASRLSAASVAAVALCVVALDVWSSATDHYCAFGPSLLHCRSSPLLFKLSSAHRHLECVAGSEGLAAVCERVVWCCVVVGHHAASLTTSDGFECHASIALLTCSNFSVLIVYGVFFCFQSLPKPNTCDVPSTAAPRCGRGLLHGRVQQNTPSGPLPSTAGRLGHFPS